MLFFGTFKSVNIHVLLNTNCAGCSLKKSVGNFFCVRMFPMQIVEHLYIYISIF